MGLYVEVLCDVQNTRLDVSGCHARCWTLRGDNASGYSVKGARAEAREQGWKLGRGKAAICPGCK